jgi:hypothetical protein
VTKPSGARRPAATIVRDADELVQPFAQSELTKWTVEIPPEEPGADK